MSSTRKWLVGSLTALGLLAAGTLAGLAYLPRYILNEVERQAASAGATLSGCQLDWSTTELVLKECHFALNDNSARGELGVTTVPLSDWKPTRVDVASVSVEVLSLHGQDLVSKLKAIDHATAGLEELPLPLRIEHGSVVFAPETGLEALRLSEAVVDGPKAQIGAKVDLPLGITGRVELARSHNELALKGPLPDSWLTARLELAGSDVAVVAAEVKAFRIAWLLPLFDKPPSAELARVRVDSQVHLRIPLQLSKSPIVGDIRATAFGARLPVPAAVAGLVSSEEISLTTELRLENNHEDATASKMKVRAGSLVLSGGGSLKWHESEAPFNLRLAGGLSCGAVVEAAAHSLDNPELAVAAARIVRQALKGEVGVVVTATGNARALGATQLVRSVTPGCGFNAQVLDGVDGFLADLAAGLPPSPQLDKLKENLSKAPKLSDLAKMPLPKLPPLRLPGSRKLQDEAPTLGAPAGSSTAAVQVPGAKEP